MADKREQDAADALSRIDPRGLIRESYRIAGLGPAEARAIFLDWALGLPRDADMAAHLAGLLARYAPAHPDHPMTALLKAGLDGTAPPARRRGGARGRRRQG